MSLLWVHISHMLHGEYTYRTVVVTPWDHTTNTVPGTVNEWIHLFYPPAKYSKLFRDGNLWNSSHCCLTQYKYCPSHQLIQVIVSLLCFSGAKLQPLSHLGNFKKYQCPSLSTESGSVSCFVLFFSQISPVFPTSIIKEIVSTQVHILASFVKYYLTI